MWFKQLQLYRLTGPLDSNNEAIQEALTTKPFIPCGSQDAISRGWVAPASHAPDLMAYPMSGAILVALKEQERILPSSVVKEMAEQRIADIEAQDQRKVGRKEKKELQEAIRQELMPRAFTRSRVCRALIDAEAGWLLIEAASATKAEALLSALRDAIGSVPARLIDTQLEPTSLMTTWMEHGPADNFTIDADCELRAPGEGGSVVRCLRHDLGAPEIRAHLDTGKLVSKLALTFDERISFMLTEDFQIKRLAMLDRLQDELGDHDSNDALFDASLLLLVREMRILLSALVEAHGGETPR